MIVLGRNEDGFDIADGFDISHDVPLVLGREGAKDRDQPFLVALPGLNLLGRSVAIPAFGFVLIVHCLQLAATSLRDIRAEASLVSAVPACSP